MNFEEQFKDKFLTKRGYSVEYKEIGRWIPTYHNDSYWDTQSQPIAIKNEKEFIRDEIFQIELEKALLEL